MTACRRVAATLALACVLLPGASVAASLIVLEARGGGYKPGQAIPSDRPVTLREGERLVLIGADGRSVTLRGAFSGPPMKAGAASSDPKLALAALVATRSARATAVGVTRSGENLSALPDPWLIDVEGPGPRCLKAGVAPIWWRSTATEGGAFTVFPVDRSWRADFRWNVGESRQAVPPLSRFESDNAFIIASSGREYAIKINILPAELDSDLMLVGWMMEKGCVQQADALLRKLSQTESDSVAPKGAGS